MTDEMMNLLSLVEKTPDADLGYAAQRMMEMEVEGLTGAAYGEKNAERLSATATVIAPGRRAPARLSCASRSCAKAHIFRAFSSRAGSPRRR